MEHWKRSYSQFKLLSNKILQREEKRGFLDYLFKSEYRYFTIQLPYYDFLRGKVFIDDMIGLTEDTPEDFSVYELICTLYMDFMQQVKKGSVSYQNIAGFLLQSKKKYLSAPTKEKRVMKQVKANLFSFEPVQEIVNVESEKEKETEVRVRLKEKFIYRGEVFLNDVAAFMNGELITFEELLIILYFDFIERVKANGNSIAVMRAIQNNFDLLND
ncbi:hypothetical protein [Peribacillus asahii]|uniref:hypothetical protein n=1 Tax=Peribacillus asahii TaxID=228899 RepID=UPI002079A728|nr:hypothetical protein [Peribacillus asahii]USK62293.1 hypothetical protein LIT37_24275 [Peribacillus asahii]